MSRMGPVEWIDKKLEDMEKWVRSKEKDYASKVEHRSPCVHCDEVVLGSIREGFTHSNGNVRCVLPDFPEDHTVRATPKSLFKENR